MIKKINWIVLILISIPGWIYLFKLIWISDFVKEFKLEELVI